MITTEDFARVRPGWQAITVATAGSDIVINGVTEIPMMFLATVTGTSDGGATTLTFSPTESTIDATTGVVTCRFYSSVDNQAYRVVPLTGVSSVL